MTVSSFSFNLLSMTMDTSEYALLGHRVKFTPAEKSDNIDSSQVIETLLDEVAKIKSEHNVQTDEAVLLSALKFASDKLILENEVKKNISQLKSSAVDALSFVESLPSAH